MGLSFVCLFVPKWNVLLSTTLVRVSLFQRENGQLHVELVLWVKSHLGMLPAGFFAVKRGELGNEGRHAGGVSNDLTPHCCFGSYSHLSVKKDGACLSLTGFVAVLFSLGWWHWQLDYCHFSSVHWYISAVQRIFISISDRLGLI